MINLKDLNLSEVAKYNRINTKVIQYNLEPIRQNGHWDVVFGIDPGNKNMGLTILPIKYNLQPILCFEITFPSDRSFIQRLKNIRFILNELVFCTSYWMDCKILISIEASAYSMRYRNTELAEARIVAVEWFMDSFHLEQENFILITPQAVRKAVFGSAKIKAETQWPQLKGDAASSLAIALAGLALKSM